MVTRFELNQDDAGRFGFVLRHQDGEVLLAGLMGDSKVMAQNDVLHARSAIREASRFVPHQGSDGSHFAVLKDKDGSVLARTRHFDSASTLQDAIASIAACVDAPLLDLTRRRNGGRRAAG